MNINRAYFRDGVEWDGESDYEPSFTSMPQAESLEAAPGVVLRPLFGQQLMISHVTFAANAVAPAHQHLQEQMSYVVEGRLEFQVGHKKQVIGPGDAVTIPGNVPHSAVAFEEGCTCIDVFSPPREAFKELMQQQRGASE